MVTITKYVWDTVSDCVLTELDENNAVTAVYTNEPQQYGGVLSQRRGTTSHYHHHDALGSTRFLTDSSGNVTDTYLYDAWGNSVASTGTTVNPFKWVGKYGYHTDNSTGLVYVRARMYQPIIAQWMSDSIWYGLSFRLNRWIWLNPAVVYPLATASTQLPNPQMPIVVAQTTQVAPFCVVRLRCIKIVSHESNLGVAQHCGLEVTHYPGGNTDHYHVMDNSGQNIPNTCDYSAGGKINPPLAKGGWWTEAEWTLSNPNLCACFKRQAALLNAEKLPYELFPDNKCDSKSSCNSNYAAKCMLGYCGLTYAFEWQIDPVGWNHRRRNCLKKAYSECSGECICYEWEDADTRYCGNMASGNISPDPPRPPFSPPGEF